MKPGHWRWISVATVISGIPLSSALASYPNSWSCSSNACTGSWTNSQNTYSIGLPNFSPAPSTEFNDANAEFPEFEPNAFGCDVDNKSIDAGLAIKKAIDTDGLGNNNQNQTEYGAILADTGSGVQAGSIVQGQSYNQSPQPATNLTPSRNSLGATNAQVVGIVHSHPHNNNASINIQNQRPSSSDWATADQLITQGANRFRLTLYIIDKWGAMRAYRYTPSAQRTSTFPPADDISSACQ